MTAVSYGLQLFYVVSACAGILIALVLGAVGLVLLTAVVHAVVHALVTGFDCLIELVAPPPSLPRATASFHHGDRR